MRLGVEPHTDLLRACGRTPRPFIAGVITKENVQRHLEIFPYDNFLYRDVCVPMRVIVVRLEALVGPCSALCTRPTPCTATALCNNPPPPPRVSEEPNESAKFSTVAKNQSHLEERLLDQAQARASCNPPFGGVVRVAYPKA